VDVNSDYKLAFIVIGLTTALIILLVVTLTN